MAELQATVAVPEPVTLPGVIAPQVRLAGAVSVRLTVPENSLSDVIVIVDVAVWPAFTAAGDEAEIVKSGLGVMKNSVIAVAAASFGVSVGRLQFVSIVFVKL